MSVPRVFVSSTYYDLKYMRSFLDSFIRSQGFEPILFEKGDIAYSPDGSLDESCYREARNADMLVLIIGGRYGSRSSEVEGQEGKSDEEYDSITKREFHTAVSAGVPVYIAVERPVYIEYETFKKNRDNEKVQWASVDNKNVFLFLESILSLKRNNPVISFSNPSEVEDWLRRQWAGLFRDMLAKRSQQGQLESMATQIRNLDEVSRTLKGYLEELITKANPEHAEEIIKNEDARLNAARIRSELQKDPFVHHIENMGISLDDFIKLLNEHLNDSLFLKALSGLKLDNPASKLLSQWSTEIPQDISHRIAKARIMLGQID